MITIIFVMLLVLPIASAAICDLQVSMINQDPYPAIPGDYVKVVFQIDGIQNTECGTVTFEVKEDFPFSLDPNTENPIKIKSGTYASQYSSFYLAPYQIRIDENALQGNNPIEVGFYSSYAAEELKEFNIYIEDSHADFEIHVKNYDYLTRTLTFEILNIEDVDVEALTVEIPKQENIQVKGANKKVIGDLDSNEYTTADFEAIVEDGEINLTIFYTDSINVRREIQKTVTFDSDYFTNRNGDNNKSTWWLYVIIILVVGWFVWRYLKKSKAKKKRMMKHHHEGHH